MLDLQLHIESEKYYNLIDRVKDIYNADMRQKMGLSEGHIANRFKAYKAIVAVFDEAEKFIPEQLDDLAVLVNNYDENLTNLGVSDAVVLEKKETHKSVLYVKSLKALLLFPLYVYGALNNAITYSLSMYLGQNFVKAQKYRPAVEVGVMAILGTLVTIAQMVVVGWFTGSFWLALAYLVTVPVTGYFAYDYWLAQNKLLEKWRLENSLKNGKGLALIKQRADIVSKIKTIVQAVETK